jgi:hypothetical protein
MTTDAPSCPVSFPQATPGAPVFHRGDPRSRAGQLHNLINSIPRAHDLRSVIHALNIMNNIITQITRGAPAVNNVHPQDGGSVILNGIDHKPDGTPQDWEYADREYEPQKLINPDDDTQFIQMKILTMVMWQNANSDANLIYEGPDLTGVL